MVSKKNAFTIFFMLEDHKGKTCSRVCVNFTICGEKLTRVDVQMSAHSSNVVRRQGNFRATAHTKASQLRVTFKMERAAGFKLLTKIF